jgi:hypothetical protein
VVDLVFTQTERVEIIDGGRNRAGVQAKPYADTRAEAFACPGASGERVIAAGMLSRAGTAVEDTVRGVLSALLLLRTILGCKPSDKLSLWHSPKGTRMFDKRSNHSPMPPSVANRSSEISSSRTTVKRHSVISRSLSHQELNQCEPA